MANRAYLYSTDHVPGSPGPQSDRRVAGIAEWAYDVPIVFKLLVSANPKLCRSLIWDVPEQIAIVGNFEQGIQKLVAFLDRISFPEVAPLREEAVSFLTNPANRGQYFLLEAGEILEMSFESLEQGNRELFEEIQHLEPALSQAINDLTTSASKQSNQQSFWSRFFGKAPSGAPVSDQITALGLANWSEILFYDPNRDSAATDE